MTDDFQKILFDSMKKVGILGSSAPASLQTVTLIAPKKKRTGYQTFYSDCHASLINGGMAKTEANTETIKQWNAMSDDEKKVWSQKAQSDAPDSVVASAPKAVRGRTGYNLYVKCYKKQKGTDFAELGPQWKAETEEVRKQWNAWAKEGVEYVDVETMAPAQEPPKAPKKSSTPPAPAEAKDASAPSSPVIDPAPAPAQTPPAPAPVQTPPAQGPAVAPTAPKKQTKGKP